MGNKKTLQLLLMVCILLVCSSLYTVSENDHSTHKPPPQSANYACVTELSLTVLGIMEQFLRNEMPRYNRFFDNALMHEVRDMFRRLYGFAVNEDQGIQWESITVRYLQRYVIHVLARYAIENYQQSHELNTNAPSSFQSLCLSQVSAQITQYLREEFRLPNIEDPVLQYELTLFTRLPVLVSRSNTAPYLIIRFREEHRHTRFLDETPISSMRGAKGNDPSRKSHFPLLYSPAVNIENAMVILNYAYTGVFRFFISNARSLRNLADLSEFVDANIVARVNEAYELNIDPARSEFSNADLIERMRSAYVFYVFFQFTINWLEEEYNRLVCHPTLIRYARSSILMKNLDIIRKKITNKSLNIFHKFDQSIFDAIYQAFRRTNPIIGYTAYRSIGIAILERSVQSFSSTEASRVFTNSL